MRSLLSLLVFAGITTGAAANSLLQNPVAGPLNTTRFIDITIAGNNTDVALIAADNTGIYAIDIADNNSSEATANGITAPVDDFVDGKLSAVAGQAVNVINIVVNPVSKSVYVLAWSGSTSFIFKVTNHGNTVTLLDLSNISYSKINWGSALSVADMAWGNNTLYVSSGSFSLDGQLGWMSAPFVHNSTITKRATSMFKSNWGGTYFTTAPLETMAFGNVGNASRLMGVTTCAPGFSLDLNGLSGSGLMEVTEDFNVNMGTPTKVEFQKQGGKSWLFVLHDAGYLYRIGEKYLDGSRVAANQYNNDAVLFRGNDPDPAPGIPQEDFKRFAGSYSAIAYLNDANLLVIEGGTGGDLTVLNTSGGATAVHEVQKANVLNIYPNPASGMLKLQLPASGKATVSLYTLEGKLVLQQQVEGTEAVLNLDQVSRGQYALTLETAEGKKLSNTVLVE